ncbi:hypothetical protein DL768_004647 [Monosporascus sp. mg162]|nr:hypothetical protein DL768_004647 [Monosporascus sp. mg162]
MSLSEYQQPKHGTPPLETHDDMEDTSYTNMVAALSKSGEKHQTEKSYDCDVLIIGSGPIGATFARKLVDADKKVLMIEMGDYPERYQFVYKGELHPLSVPTPNPETYLEPTSWDPDPLQVGCLQNGQNPNQQSWDNLPAAAASRVVGGMGSHWTCCTPRPDELEQSTLFTQDEWAALYDTAEELFRTNDKMFDDSIRQQLVKKVLYDAYANSNREIKSMPLAGKRDDTIDYIDWSCSASILGDLSDIASTSENFEIRPNTQCLKLLRNTKKDPVEITGAYVENLQSGDQYTITAKKYVVCAGAILTPGILFQSGITNNELSALGHYMTEQIMSFCQVVLKRSLVDAVENDSYGLGWAEKVKKHREKYPSDPLPFPFNDPDPQCYFPFSKTYPWHTQIHRDAYGYGEVPRTIDQRLVVDFRWFTYAQPVESNYVEFSSAITDEFGMPQPTFHFRPSDDDAERCQRMITE